MKSIRSFALATATTALVAFSSPSSAVVLNNSGGGANSANFSWNFYNGFNFLSGTGSVTASGFNSSSLSLLFTLNNTSPNGGQGGDRLAIFGFGINPNFTSVAFVDANDGGMESAGTSNFPAVAGIEACASGGNNCAGAGNGGIFAGASDTFTINLAGTWGASVNVSPIAFKYQTGNGSFEFTTSTSSTSSGGNTSSSGQVPESGTLSLLGLGLLGLGFARRRMQRG